MTLRSGADQEPDSWHVSADVSGDSGMDAESHFGDMTIVVVDLYQTRDPFSQLDGEDADLGAVAGTVFNARTGELDPDLDDLLEPPSAKSPPKRSPLKPDHASRRIHDHS
jgi:hypothetical protein